MSLQIKEAPKQLIKRSQVEALTSLSRSSIYRLMALSEFPKPINITSKAVAWVQSDVEAWIDDRISASKGV
jgi:prophage regulatory protein